MANIRIRVDGEMMETTDEIFIRKKIKKHSIEIVVDRIIVSDKSRSRLFDSLEAALRLAEGYAIVDVIGQEEILFSEHLCLSSLWIYDWRI